MELEITPSNLLVVIVIRPFFASQFHEANIPTPDLRGGW